jgi:aspartyl-tRNA(Asn)/glutamyl-tRNA(Gln) amidotransferase subunit B
VRPEKQAELGAKIEIKNMNSISGVRRALAFEIQRQTKALERGDKLQQETRGWDDAAGETFLMRTKESAHDYRYFPDPDLVPVKSEVLLADARARVPELPKAKRARFIDQYQVTPACWRTTSILRVISKRPPKARRNRRMSRTGS